MNAPFLILQTGQPTRAMRRHGSFSHWIRVAAALEREDAIVIDVQGGEPLPARDGFAGVIVTGSAAMVTQRLEWSERSAAWLRESAQAGLPIFGICYGHQLLAHALGGKVDDNPAGREMGTVPVELLPAAAHDPLFVGLPAAFSVQATHLQVVLRAPEGAVALARAKHDACHAFRHGEAAWGVQFHPEFSTTHMRGYIAARRDVLKAEGFDPDTLEIGVAATPVAREVLRRFVRHARKLGRGRQ